MKFTPTLFAFFVTVALADGAPGAQDPAGKEICDEKGTTMAGQLKVAQNMWGKKDALPGAVQCTTGSEKGFKVRWDYDGAPDKVKSFPNIGLDLQKAQRKPMTQITSIPTTATWKYNTTAIRADVAYDVFTAKDVTRESNWSGDFELMVWLARFGDVNPVGTNKGKVQVGEQNWEFWEGSITVAEGPQHVFSFVAEKPIETFNGDIKKFFNYVQANATFPAEEQNLINVQFGTEPFTGKNAGLEVTDFTASFN